LQLVFTSPGYVAPLEGSIISGANVPKLNTGPGSTIDIACSHPFTVWAEFDRPLTTNPLLSTWNPVNLVPMATTSRIAVANNNPSTPGNDPFLTTIKTFVNPLKQTFADAIITPIPSVVGVMSGVIVNGSFAGSEAGVGPASQITSMIRPPTYLIMMATYKGTAGTRGDVFYVGDLSAPGPWLHPYAFWIVYGRALNALYDGTTTRYGFWSPQTEQGDLATGTVFCSLFAQFSAIGRNNTDIVIPRGLAGGALAGEGLAGLQGTIMPPT
jgi:hypothetical protein